MGWTVEYNDLSAIDTDRVNLGTGYWNVFARRGLVDT
jgi:hypothetical protein